MVSTLDLKSFFGEDRGSSPGVAGYLVWNGGQCRGSVISTRVDPDVNVCL